MNDTDDLDDLQAFALPTGPRHPADIAARLMTYPEHRHLADNDITFGYLMRLSEKVKGGKRELASVNETKTMFQGGYKDLCMQLLAGMLGHLPAYLVVIDAEYWAQCTDLEADALLFHELAHVQQKLDKYGAPRFGLDGLPVYGIAAHDVTAFKSEVARYGLWSPDLRDFMAVAREAE